MNFSLNNYKHRLKESLLVDKALKNVLLITLVLTCFQVWSQDGNNQQAYVIHEDRVKPGMVEEYEQIAKDLVAACKEHNIQEINWMTVAQDDNTYLYITPLEKFAELDVNNFSFLEMHLSKV